MPLGTFESDSAICCRCCAGHQAAASGDTTGAFGVSAVKVRARAGNPVQVGCLQTRWTTRVETYAVAALLVGHDEQDIWSRYFSPLCLRGWLGILLSAGNDG